MNRTNCKREFTDDENCGCIKCGGHCIECEIYVEDIMREQEREQETMRISHDMAIDAGMPEIEGMEI